MIRWGLGRDSRGIPARSFIRSEGFAGVSQPIRRGLATHSHTIYFDWVCIPENLLLWLYSLHQTFGPHGPKPKEDSPMLLFNDAPLGHTLTETYRPRRVADFIGLPNPKKGSIRAGRLVRLVSFSGPFIIPHCTVGKTVTGAAVPHNQRRNMLRTAIKIEFVPCTATRPDRLKATTMSDHPTSATVGFWNYDSDDERYTAALSALLAKMGDGWGDASQWIAGATASGRVYIRLYLNAEAVS